MSRDGSHPVHNGGRRGAHRGGGRGGGRGHHQRPYSNRARPSPTTTSGAAARAAARSSRSSSSSASLASLLSSQRRSIAQSDRHRMQRARPFADRAQVERAAKAAGGDDDSCGPRNGDRRGNDDGNCRRTLRFRRSDSAVSASPPRARFRPPSDVEGTRAEATRDAATPRNKSGWGPPRTNTVARNDDDEPFAAHDDDEPFRRDASTAEGGRDGRATPRTSVVESSGRFFGGEAGESRRTSRSGRPPAADGRISEGEGRRNFAPRFAREPRDGGDEEGNGSGERASLESSPSPQLESPGREGTDSSEGRPAFRGARTEPDGERRRAPAPEVSPRTRSERRTPDEPRRVSRGSPAAAASAFRSSTEDDPPPPRRRSPDVAADAPDGRGERASSHGGGRAPAIPRKRPRSRGTDREESRPRPRGGGEGGSEAPSSSSAKAGPTSALAGPDPSTANEAKGPPRDARWSIEARGSTDGGVAPASATKDCGAVGGRSPSTVEDGTSSSEVPRRRNSAGASDEDRGTDRADAAARSRERGDEASRDPCGEREGGERRTEAKGKKKEKKKKRRRTESADDASPTGEEARGKTARRSGRDAETHRADPAPPWERADEASRDPDEKRGWDGPGLLRAKKTKTKKKKRRDAAAYDASMTDPSEATKTGGGFSSTDARSAAEPGATERAPSSEREDESACGLREDGARDARREEKKQKKKKKRRAESSAGDESAARRSDSTNGERTSAVDPNDNAAFDGATLAPQDGGKKRKKKKKKKMTRRDEAADDASMIHRSDSEEEATKSEDATKLSDEHGSKAEPDGNAATIGGALAPPFEGGGEARPERAPTELARTSEKRKGESGASRSERFARDPASGASSSPTTKRRKKAFGPFRVKVGRVVAVRFRKLADGGNPGVVPVRRDGGSFRATTASSPERVFRTSSERTGRSLNNGGSAPDSDDGVEVERKKGPADASGEVDLDAEAEAPAAAGAKRIARRKPKQYEVWSDPIPGRDDGPSLPGSWIRCVFPKSFVAARRERNEGKGTARRPMRRSAEGTVVSTYGTDRGVGVRLLVDRASLRDLSHLEVVDDCDDVAVSSSERKRRKLEARIRGADKVLVEATLASAYDKVRGSKLRPGVVSHWAVRKRVVAKAAGKRPSKAERKRTKQHADALFVGDGNDAPSQQEQNWRWIASRARGPVDAGTNRSLVGNDNEQDPVSQLVGEVVRVDISPAQSENGSSSLALVTVKSLWTPEQTERGRLAHHGAFELFDFCHSDSDGSYFQAPIEDLIVIGKRISRTRVGNRSQAKAGSGAGEDPGWAFAVSHSYHPGDDTFTPLSEPGVATKRTAACHYCQKLYDCSTLHKCPHEKKGTESSWCVRCLRFVRVPVPCNDGGKWTGPCCTGECDCPVCTRNARKQSKEHNAGTTIGGIGESFLDLERSLQSVSPVDFTLPSDTGELTLRPSFLPLTGSSKSQSYGKAKSKDKKKPIAKQGKRKRKRAASVTDTNGAEKPQADVPELLEEDNIFKPECHRTTPFDYINKACWGTSKRRFVSDNAEQPFFRENARPRAVKIGKTEEKIALSGRAARANQRRMFKSLAAFGGGSKNVDRLAGRDRVQQLRFDKSRIHGWGVFTEDAIAAGDMIIEYRGELIGNAVANKRELEYERAKLDDYMFRIDAFTVCDATILGNVARYINASCRPNCHTQIITAGENKRIVIYAKRDIKRGEELCYDYKFSLEYDPSKRILCHCGSPHCRGFMNWDKKYV